MLDRYSLGTKGKFNLTFDRGEIFSLSSTPEFSNRGAVAVTLWGISHGLEMVKEDTSATVRGRLAHREARVKSG